MDDPTDKSLGDDATYAGAKARDEVSLGDERTLGGGEAVGLDTLIDEIEVVDLESRYKVEGTLGQGGMGAVLLATDTRLGRKVAIKRILGEAARSKTAIMRFLTEAKAIAALNHPNIVQIYDYGRAEDGPFLIMEYVDGGSLADRCKQGAIPLEEAVELACQICDGLAKAHDAGIVHRDIKPANVLLNRDNLPKLTDFGLAKAEAADHGMTMTGAVMGTPDFMPPEQRRDAALVDHRSDLWSLAASVYQMVTGRSPKIIRFNDVPAVLQDVLARALEEEKDARYQSARELRDALKTSVRAASAAVEELVQGQCPACGVKNDAGRRFCRGCGESLEAPCLACTRPMPMWEEICGSCGAKQTPLLDERRQAMAARQAEAEGLLGEFAFDRATEVATQLRDTSHPKLRHLTGWTTSFFERVEVSRAEQMRHAAEVLAEARKHEAAHDYLSAAFALETIPEVMRSSLIPGTREPAGRMLERVRKTQADVRRLESLVKERLAARQFDDLLPDVDKLLALRPDRADIIKVRTQLVERQQKQAGHRDKAIETARASLAEHDYEAALAGLSSVAAAAVTPEVVKLREQAEELVRKVRSLAKKIKDKVAAKDLDGLIGTVEQYLALKPADGEHVALRQSLAAREEKIAGEITARCEQAAALEKACRFDDAIKLLGAIPESRRSEAVLELLDRASQRATWRRSAMTALGAATPQTFEAAIAIGRDYAAAIDSGNLSDTDFTALLQKVEAARDRAVQSRRLKLVTGAAAAGIAAVVAIVVAGMWIRSAVKTASLARAIEQGRWDDALTMSPDNTAALVGRARAKLQATPPDVDSAFADLDRAERSGRSTGDLRSTRGDGYAVRATEHAAANRLDEAEQDYRDASALNASATFLGAAKAALVRIWLERATTHLAAKDIPQTRAAIDATRRYGADEQSVAPLVVDALLLEGFAIHAAGDDDMAAAKITDACLIDATRVAGSLAAQSHERLRAAVVNQCRMRCDQAIARNDWDTALRAASAAGVLDPSTSPWIGDVIKRFPGGPTSVPRDVLTRLPAFTLAALPPELVGAVPIPVTKDVPGPGTSRDANDSDGSLRAKVNGVWELVGGESLGEYRALTPEERAEAKAKNVFLRIFPDGELSMGPDGTGRLVESRLGRPGNVVMTNGQRATLRYDGKVLCLDLEDTRKFYWTKVE